MQCPWGAVTARILFSVKGKNCHGVFRIYIIYSQEVFRNLLKTEAGLVVCSLDFSKYFKAESGIIKKKGYQTINIGSSLPHLLLSIKSTYYLSS
jgi:hypothetical protein